RDDREGRRHTVHEPGEQEVERDYPEERPERERQATRPLPQPEESQAERDARERKLALPELTRGRNGIVRAVDDELLAAEQSDRNPAREIGDVELVRLPDAARGYHPEEARRCESEREHDDSAARPARLRIRHRDLVQDRVLCRGLLGCSFGRGGGG